MNYPLTTFIRSLTYKKCDNVILNSGCYMGYVKYLLLFFNELCKSNNCSDNGDDQILLNNFCIKSDFFNKYIYIDKLGDLFYNAACKNNLFYLGKKCDNDGLNIINEKVINPLTHRSPSFIHGPSHLELNRYCELFNYPLAKKRENIFIFLIKNNITMQIIFIILFVIICLIFYFLQSKKSHILL